MRTTLAAWARFRGIITTARTAGRLKRDHRPDGSTSGDLGFLDRLTGRMCGPKFLLGGDTMSKGNNQRGNKESKKPKQEKPKPPATANFSAGKSAVVTTGKKTK
jgi:hypothetical protein